MLEEHVGLRSKTGTVACYPVLRAAIAVVRAWDIVGGDDPVFRTLDIMCIQLKALGVSDEEHIIVYIGYLKTKSMK